MTQLFLDHIFFSRSLPRVKRTALAPRPRLGGFGPMTTVGVAKVRHHTASAVAFAPAFTRVESAVPDASPCLIALPEESSPPRGETTDTASLRMAPYQVAGHSSKGVGLPSLVDDAGHFLKPCPDDRKGAAEVDFYRRVVSARDSGLDLRTTLAGFARFVPAYRGTFRVDAAGLVAVAGDDPTAAHARTIAATGQRAVFLRLEDVTSGYAKPCVIDLKIGLRTFSPNGHDPAYIAKRSKHDIRSGQAEVGFKVCGMQTWERVGVPGGEGGESLGTSYERGNLPDAKRGLKNTSGEWLQRRRPYDWARNLCNKDAVRAALEEFVGCGGRAGGTQDANNEDGGSPNAVNSGFGEASFGETAQPLVDVAQPVCRASEVFGEALTQLAGLRAWFATQRELHLLGSSVLIVYEGDPDARAGETKKTRVCVIDFCNYVKSQGEVDDNFAVGLERLSDMMASIVENEEGRPGEAQ